jgi:DNA-binding MarR family transcriptional regulator
MSFDVVGQRIGVDISLRMANMNLVEAAVYRRLWYTPQGSEGLSARRLAELIGYSEATINFAADSLCAKRFISRTVTRKVDT